MGAMTPTGLTSLGQSHGPCEPTSGSTGPPRQGSQEATAEVSQNDTTAAGAAAQDEAAILELTKQLSEFNWKEGVVDRAKRLLYSRNTEENKKGVAALKAMLCIGREEVYSVAQEIIDTGAIQRLVQFLSMDHDKQLQLQAAFCLTNVAAGLDSQTRIVVDAGAIAPLIQFLRLSESQLRRQAIFCLANIGGSTSECRMLLAQHPDFFPALCVAGDETQDPKILELICWNLRNVCLLGGPSFSEVAPGIRFLLKILLRFTADTEWLLPLWLGCARFALETVSAACRDPIGRAIVFEQNPVEHLLMALDDARRGASSESLRGHQWRSVRPIAQRSLPPSPDVANVALEAIAWLLAYGGSRDRALLAVHSAALAVLFDLLLLRNSTVTPQNELAYRCFAALACAALQQAAVSRLALSRGGDSGDPLDYCQFHSTDSADAAISRSTRGCTICSSDPPPSSPVGGALTSDRVVEPTSESALFGPEQAGLRTAPTSASVPSSLLLLLPGSRVAAASTAASCASALARTALDHSDASSSLFASSNGDLCLFVQLLVERPELIDICLVAFRAPTALAALWMASNVTAGFEANGRAGRSAPGAPLLDFSRLLGEPSRLAPLLSAATDAASAACDDSAVAMAGNAEVAATMLRVKQLAGFILAVSCLLASVVPCLTDVLMQGVLQKGLGVALLEVFEFAADQIRVTPFRATPKRAAASNSEPLLGIESEPPEALPCIGPPMPYIPDVTCAVALRALLRIVAEGHTLLQQPEGVTPMGGEAIGNSNSGTPLILVDNPVVLILSKNHLHSRLATVINTTPLYAAVSRSVVELMYLVPAT